MISHTSFKRSTAILRSSHQLSMALLIRHNFFWRYFMAFLRSGTARFPLFDADASATLCKIMLKSVKKKLQHFQKGSIAKGTKVTTVALRDPLCHDLYHP